MIFSEFAKTLYPFCGNGETPSNFLVALLGAVTNEQSDPLFDKSSEYLKRIYEGQKKISKTSASYILCHLEKESFDSYIFNLVSDDALAELCDKFAPYAGSSTKDDISTKIAALFISILEEIARGFSVVAPASDEKCITISGGKLFIGNEEVKLPDRLAPPANFEEDEAVYIAELLFAYAEAEGVATVAPDALSPKYQRNLTEQRQNYFNAEAVRRRVRDVFTDRDEFEVLKTETYDGIVDVHSQNWANGFERLLKVLAQSAVVRIDKSLLGSQLTWIGNSEKKGVCHILVNEGRIKWVVTE